MRVRRAHRREQLQHVLASARREEDVPSAEQPGQGEADADPRLAAARKPLLVRPDAHQEMGGPRGQANTMRHETTSREAKKATQKTHAQSVHGDSPQTKHATETKAQEG